MSSYYDLTNEKTFDEKLIEIGDMIDKKNKKIIKDIHLNSKFDNAVLNELFNLNVEQLNDIFDYSKKNDEITLDYIIKNITHFNFYESIYKQNFASILQEEVSDGIYQCPKCKSKLVNTVTRQIRSADEPATDSNTCNNCGHNWRIN
jgi:DNA-directed RNA polymerase subunit M/transcription elongation factor TFIIS